MRYLEFGTERVNNAGLKNFKRVIIGMQQFPITQTDNPGSDIEHFALFSERLDLLNDREFKSGDSES
jgi:hypothetical protein